jgi:threonine aldolase
VAGDRAAIARVFRFRKMFGGAMRQAGILAAAALYALDHHRKRLGEDHANAAALADGLRNLGGLTIPMPVETNMVFVDVDQRHGTAGQVCEKLKASGVLALPTAPQRIRFVCHLDVSRPMIDRAVEVIAAAVGAGKPAPSSRPVEARPSKRTARAPT